MTSFPIEIFASLSAWMITCLLNEQFAGVLAEYDARQAQQKEDMRLNGIKAEKEVKP